MKVLNLFILETILQIVINIEFIRGVFNFHTKQFKILNKTS